VRENNQALGKTWTYEYDTAGNILKKKEYNYTNISDLSELSYTEKVYGYATSGWKDRLTSYDGVTISYDAVGNPLSYRGKLHSWTKGRLLSRVLEPADNNGGTIITRAITPIDESYSTSFEYNADGIRTKKIWYNPITDATTTTEYKLSGTTILSETTTGAYTRTIRYIYTNNELVGFEYNGNAYYYRKNLFGDIVEIYDSSNNLVASYTYDAWGNCTFGANVDNIANVNPFRYRGYYYDWETRYYYLQTRYYDAEVGRFLNADDVKYLNPKMVHGCNLYSYCKNCPVMAIDVMGTTDQGYTFTEALEELFSVHETIIQVLDPIVNGFDLLFEYLALDELTDAQIAQIMKETGRSEYGIRNANNRAAIKTAKMGNIVSTATKVLAVVAVAVDISSCIIKHAENSENNEDWVADCAEELAAIAFTYAVGSLVSKICLMAIGGVAGIIVSGVLSYVATNTFEKLVGLQ